MGSYWRVQGDEESLLHSQSTLATCCNDENHVHGRTVELVRQNVKAARV